MLEELAGLLARVLPVDRITTEIVAGGIGALVLAVFEWSTRFGRNLYLRRKYPVAGRFVTFFEDEKAGERTVQACSSKLRQRGLDISGWTKLPSGRSWTLKGKVVKEKYVAGVYDAEDPADGGVGSFFLTREQGDLDGVWTGFDHVNMQTTTGRYWFKRIRRVKVKRYRPRYRAAVLDILDQTFGQGYLSDIDAAATKDNSTAMVAREGRRVVGFGHAYVADENSLDELARSAAARPTPDLSDADHRGRLGVLRTIAVAPLAQGRGVGTQLLNKLEEFLWHQGAAAILVPAWRGASGINVGGLLETARYRRWCEVPRYWKAECDADEFACPDRTNECVCDVVFFKKTAGR